MDWGEVARSYGEEFQKSGGDVKVNFEVESITMQVMVRPNHGPTYPFGV